MLLKMFPSLSKPEPSTQEWCIVVLKLFGRYTVFKIIMNVLEGFQKSVNLHMNGKSNLLCLMKSLVHVGSVNHNKVFMWGSWKNPQPYIDLPYIDLWVYCFFSVSINHIYRKFTFLTAIH